MGGGGGGGQKHDFKGIYIFLKNKNKIGEGFKILGGGAIALPKDHLGSPLN
jgi:hypothetical protein